MDKKKGVGILICICWYIRSELL